MKPRLRQAAGAVAFLCATAQMATAQGAMDCQAIVNDVTVTDAHAYMPPAGAMPEADGLGDRTSGQILERWATIQDADPQACVTLKQVQARLSAEGALARTQCPDVVSTIDDRLKVARSEIAVVCGRAQ